LASELFASSPNPFRKRTYSRFDPASALPRLRVLAVGDVVAISEPLAAFLSGRKDATLVGSSPPYTVFHLADDGGGYLEPLRLAARLARQVLPLVLDQAPAPGLPRVQR